VLVPANPSAGQVSAVPLQVSATSQTPADLRQTVPLASAEQVPTLLATVQLPQASVQAVLQHTPPAAQCWLVHWLLAEQVAPLGLVPQELMLPFIPQVFGETHCVSTVQEL
jgi:hypothetical protein